MDRAKARREAVGFCFFATNRFLPTVPPQEPTQEDIFGKKSTTQTFFRERVPRSTAVSLEHVLVGNGTKFVSHKSSRLLQMACCVCVCFQESCGRWTGARFGSRPSATRGSPSICRPGPQLLFPRTALPRQFSRLRLNDLLGLQPFPNGR